MHFNLTSCSFKTHLYLFSLILIYVVYLGYCSKVHAHHPTSNYGLQAAAPQNSFEIDGQFASYPKTIDGYGGSWWLTDIRTEYRVFKPFSVALNIPYALVQTK